MRLLVLDPSHILAWIVRHEHPELEVDEAADFDQAARRLAEWPPDAALVSLPPASVPWRDFQRRCSGHHPAVPVLYESCLPVERVAAGLEEGDGWAEFLLKPASRAELAAALDRLLAAAGTPASAPLSPRRGS